MGNFSNNAITDVGRILLADVQAGGVFTPTRIVIGSGSMSGGATAQGMTEVIHPVKSLAINKKKRTPDGKCVFGGVYTNEEITEPFYFRELAMYAKAVYLNADGTVKSEGPETLYSYGNAGATADYMPAYSTSTVVEKQMDLVIWVGNETQVDLTIESGINVTRADFMSHAARHAIGGEDPITPASIGAAPAGFGLGSDSTLVANCDDAMENGWYFVNEDTLNRAAGITYGSLFVLRRTSADRAQLLFDVSNGAIAQRVMPNGVWQQWEWINPPFGIGVEYRTIEHKDGKAVFKRLDADGVLRYRLDGESVWNTYAKECGAAPAGYGYGGEPLPIYTGTEQQLEGYFSEILATMKPASTKQIAFGCSDSNMGQLGTFMGTVKKFTEDYSHITASIYGGYMVSKSFLNYSWLPFEWVNPQLVIGAEYRTTDRYQGAVVFKKTDGSGNILWRAEHETTWRLLHSASALAPATVE